MRLIAFIYAISVFSATLATGSPGFASEPGGNRAISLVLTGSGSRSGASGSLLDDEPQSFPLDPQTSRTRVSGEQLAQIDEAKALIALHRAEIFGDPDSPVEGSAAADVTIVEFFDYNCPYCRLVAPTLQEIERTDPKVKFIYKEFPILGPGSEFAARAALAAQAQGKFTPFHRALIAADEQVGESTVMEIARSVGLDIARLKKDMEDPRIMAAIERNLALAQSLRIQGTPSFVINDGIFRGAADLEAFRGVIAKARGQ